MPVLMKNLKYEKNRESVIQNACTKYVYRVPCRFYFLFLLIISVRITLEIRFSIEEPVITVGFCKKITQN